MHIDSWPKTYTSAFLPIGSAAGMYRSGFQTIHPRRKTYRYGFPGIGSWLRYLSTCDKWIGSPARDVWSGNTTYRFPAGESMYSAPCILCFGRQSMGVIGWLSMSRSGIRHRVTHPSIPGQESSHSRMSAWCFPAETIRTSKVPQPLGLRCFPRGLIGQRLRRETLLDGEGFRARAFFGKDG